MLKVLGRKTSGNVQKVLFALEEMGAAYEREDYGRQFGNTGGEYLAMNPAGKVPTLVDGDVVIWESNTILRYLAAKHAPALAGESPADKADVERWMDFLLAAINPGYMAAFKGSKLDSSERPEGFDADVKGLHDNLAILNAHLEGKEHFALGRMTLACIAMAPIVSRCLDFPLDRPAMQALEGWRDCMAERPAYVAATS